jgi:hypothetical protein
MKRQLKLVQELLARERRVQARMTGRARSAIARKRPPIEQPHRPPETTPIGRDRSRV